MARRAKCPECERSNGPHYRGKCDHGSNARINAAHLETQRVVATGKCPECGAGLRRNLSITGWWQCKQLGAVGFREDASKPSCSWQGFTE